MYANFIKCCQKPNATFTIFDLQHHCIDPCTTGTCRAADFCRVSFHFEHYYQISADNSFQITLDLSIFLEIDFNEVHLMLAISIQILPGAIRCFVIVTQIWSSDKGMAMPQLLQRDVITNTGKYARGVCTEVQIAERLTLLKLRLQRQRNP